MFPVMLRNELACRANGFQFCSVLHVRIEEAISMFTGKRRGASIMERDWLAYDRSTQ